MNTRQLGTSGPRVSAIGLGTMGMSDMYGPSDRAESIATIHAALDAGVNLLDTGDFYGMGHNEMLIAEALRGRSRDDVLLSVKFGALRDPAGGWSGYDARPQAVKNSLAYTLRRLQTEYVDVYRPSRLDPAVPQIGQRALCGRDTDGAARRHWQPARPALRSRDRRGGAKLVRADRTADAHHRGARSRDARHGGPLGKGGRLDAPARYSQSRREPGPAPPPQAAATLVKASPFGCTHHRASRRLGIDVQQGAWRSRLRPEADEGLRSPDVSRMPAQDPTRPW